MNDKVELVKWADYLISAVRYESGSEKRIISYLKVHKDNINFVGEGRTWSKEELLEALKEGNSLATIRKDSKGRWFKNNNVAISSFYETSISSDYNNIPGDYLENVPEF